MSRVLTVVALLGWLTVLIWSIFSFRTGAPGMAVIGVAIAAVAPMAFVSGFRSWSLVSPTDPHPVMASVLTGFGVVLTMVAVNRYGEQLETHVIAAGFSLALWLVWVRWSWRKMFGSGSQGH